MPKRIKIFDRFTDVITILAKQVFTISYGIKPE